MLSAVETDFNFSRETLRETIESKTFEWTITALILFNAAIMGLETNDHIEMVAGPMLQALDHALLVMFSVELVLRLIVYRAR